MMKNRFSLLVAALFILSFLAANSQTQDLNVKIGAYVDAYIATDNDHSSQFQSNPTYPLSRQLTYVDYYKNEFDLNLAQISANIDYKGIIRSKITLQAGSLANRAYNTANPIIQEANVGFKLADKFWVDGGYFMTHIGGESFAPKDNWLSSHSIVTYFEPFFQAGLKASYEFSPNFTACIHILNGNGILQDNNDNKSFGWQLAYAADKNIFAASYNGIIGNEEPGSPNNSKTHMFHNLCLSTDAITNFSLKAQIDYATKSDFKDPDNHGQNQKSGSFFGASIQGKYQFIPEFSATLRLAGVDNKDDIYGYIDGYTFIHYQPPTNAIQASLGVEYKPFAKSYIRLEGGFTQYDNSYRIGNTNPANEIFKDPNGKGMNHRLELLLNFGVWID
jgi:hypothetical protein